MKQETVILQMEALQRIHIFRLFDVFSLLDCLYSLRSGGLQVCLQLCFYFFYLKYTDNPAVPGEPLRKTDNTFSNLNFATFCIRRLLAVAL